MIEMDDKQVTVYAEDETGERIRLTREDLSRLLGEQFRTNPDRLGWVRIAFICLATALASVTAQGLLHTTLFETGRVDSILDRLTLLSGLGLAALVGLAFAWQRSLIARADTTLGDIHSLIAEIDAEIELDSNT